jgi:multiple sugar transport system permease protein
MKRRIPVFLGVALVVVWTLLPMYWFLKFGFQTPAETARFPPSIFPQQPQVSAFYNILGFQYVADDGRVSMASGQARQILTGLRNSAVLAISVTMLTLLVVVPMAYIYARFEFRFKTGLLMAVLLSVALPPVVTLIPFFEMYMRLGLLGTLRGLILVTLTLTIPFVTWMLIGYFRNLPPVEKLARIDGFSRLSTFVRIVVPMAKGGIAVGAIIAFLFAWNEFTFAQILVNGTPATTLPASISGFLFQHPEPAHLSASVFLSVLPPFLVAFVLQRNIARLNIVDPLR